MNNTIEKWLPVVGWESIYEVSDYGRVRRVASGRGAIAGKLLKPIKHINGYQVAHFRFNGRNSIMLLHRVVCAAFLGKLPDGKEVNHKNGDRGDNRLVNLEYVTRSENLKHKFRVLKSPPIRNKGESAGRAKLTNAQVIEIRRRYSTNNVSQQSLALEFGVSQPVIGFIVRRVTWKHI